MFIYLYPHDPFRHVYKYAEIIDDMVPDTAQASETHADCEVMAAIDSDQLVIADICRDEAWLTMPVSATATLPDWR
jgi:hypothetical protein